MRGRGSTADVPGTADRGFKRILAVLEGCDTDHAVTTRAIEAAEASGGFLTIVAVVDLPKLRFDGGSPLVGPSLTREYLAEHATASLWRAAARIPDGMRFQTGLEDGARESAIARRARANGHDLIILGRRPFRVARPSWGTLTTVVEVMRSRESEAAAQLSS